MGNKRTGTQWKNEEIYKQAFYKRETPKLRSILREAQTH